MLDDQLYFSHYDKDTFKVQSQTNPTKFYFVSKTGNRLICECHDHQVKKSDCKHIKLTLTKQVLCKF